MVAKKASDKRTAKRKSVQERLEFYIDDEKIEAESVDVSETGVRFNTRKPINIWMRMASLGPPVVREARLVWAKKRDEEGMSYAFEFVSEK